MESHRLLWNHDTWSAISMKRADWEISWNPLFLIHFMACGWWIWLSGLSVIGCFPELSDYSQLSDYNCTEWSMKNKTAYAPMISEFGKATRSKSFHVRYTWFNDQTIMRKFYCYSLFNLCLENSFSQNVQFFNFIFYFVFYYVLFSICQLHVLCCFSPLRLGSCALLLSCFLIGVTFELSATDSYVVCTKVKFAL